MVSSKSSYEKKFIDIADFNEIVSIGGQEGKSEMKELLFIYICLVNYKVSKEKLFEDMDSLVSRGLEWKDIYRLTVNFSIALREKYGAQSRLFIKAFHRWVNIFIKAKKVEGKEVYKNDPNALALYLVTWSSNNRYDNKDEALCLLESFHNDLSFHQITNIFYFNQKIFKNYERIYKSISEKGCNKDLFRVLAKAKENSLHYPLKRNLAGDRKYKILLLIAGQMRSWQDSVSNWNGCLFQDNIDIDVAISTWDAEGKYSPTGYRFKDKKILGECFVNTVFSLYDGDMQTIFAQYMPSVSRYFYEEKKVDSNSVIEKFLAQNGVRNVRLNIENEADYQSFSNPMKMYFQNQKALSVSHEHIHNYDYVVKIRPDFIFKGGFSLREILSTLDAMDTKTIATETKLAIKVGELRVGDQFAVGAPQAMQKYLSTWDDDLKNKSCLGIDKNFFAGHFNLALQLCMQNINVYAIDSLKNSRSKLDGARIRADIRSLIEKDREYLGLNADKVISTLGY